MSDLVTLTIGDLLDEARNLRSESMVVQAQGRQLQRQAATTSTATVDQVARLVAAVQAVEPAADVAAELGWTVDRVIEVSGRFGAWVTHVLGGAPLKTVPASKAAGGHVLVGPDAVAVVPAGMSRTRTQRREIRRSIAGIVWHQPGRDMIERWVLRTVGADVIPLSREHVVSVAMMARLAPGGFATIPTDGGPSARFAEAYELLEEARRRLVRAADALLAITDTDAVGAAKIAKLVDAAGPLLGDRERRLQRALAIGDGDLGLVERQLVFLRQDRDAEPDRFAPSTIADLDPQVVRRIADAAGLDSEDRHRIESELRGRLRGLLGETDLDRFVPLGVAAVESSMEDDYWFAVEAWVDGDPAHVEELQGVVLTGA